MASRILLGVFVLYLATQTNADGSLRVGEFTKDSKLLYHGNFDAMGFIFLKRTETFDIKLTDGGKIKAIDIQDLRGDSSSWILAGGVGEDFATIKLESKRSSGYNFVIDVYGYDDDDDEFVGDQPSDADDVNDNTGDDKETEDKDKDKEETDTEDKDKEDYEKEPEKDGPKEEEDKKEENPDEDKKEETEAQ